MTLPAAGCSGVAGGAAAGLLDAGGGGANGEEGDGGAKGVTGGTIAGDGIFIGPVLYWGRALVA